VLEFVERESRPADNAEEPLWQRFDSLTGHVSCGMDSACALLIDAFQVLGDKSTPADETPWGRVKIDGLATLYAEAVDRLIRHKAELEAFTKVLMQAEAVKRSQSATAEKGGAA